ncbi:MAG TPA: hypothetical protein VF501_07520, partial [Thiobacillus sp.]
FRSWLFAIAHNGIVDVHRARRAHPPLDAAVDVLDAAPSPEDLALASAVMGSGFTEPKNRGHKRNRDKF